MGCSGTGPSVWLVGWLVCMYVCTYHFVLQGGSGLPMNLFTVAKLTQLLLVNKQTRFFCFFVFFWILCAMCFLPALQRSGTAAEVVAE